MQNSQDQPVRHPTAPQPFHDDGTVDGARAHALRTEQRHLDHVYSFLDGEREATAALLTDVLARGGDGGTHQSLVDREAAATEYGARLARLNSVESGLCFGRIDTADGTARYIGRLGLRGERSDDALEPLLVDWRAPAARPFYAASAGSPSGIVRRRHLHTFERRVTGVDDETFGAGREASEDATSTGLVGEAALLAEVGRARTGRMGDIVATIQREQDRVVRSGLPGVLVVEGGPGTGKTVAALHRAAYLLYTHRNTLARRGVLIVGPNRVFLRYISEVLPSLGETDVVLRDVGGLHPGVQAERTDSAETAVVKGDLRMAQLLHASVQQRQRDPDGALHVETEGARPGTTERLTVPQEICTRARLRAQSLGMPHNMARKRFVTDLLAALVEARATLTERPLDDEELRHGPGELWAQRSVRAALDALWPPLTPEALVTELLTDPTALHRAAGELLDEAARTALLRSPAATWTRDDVPLLDEAAELLGRDDSADRAQERRQRAERVEQEQYVREVLQMTGVAEGGLVDVADLMERHVEPALTSTTAQRAAADRSWAYGHVIVDEAQELSPMAWRTVMRRVPGRSMTVVGDLAQTGSAAGATSWAEALDPYVRGRWKRETLTVNYRTPAQVMAPAARLLAAVAPGQRAPESVRTGTPPRVVRAPDGGLVDAAVEAARAEQAALQPVGGRLAVLAAPQTVALLTTALPEAVTGGGEAALDAATALLTPVQAKGLEFDRVVLVDPAGVLAATPTGGRDLYVACTRVTDRLTLVHEGELPDVLAAFVE